MNLYFFRKTSARNKMDEKTVVQQNGTTKRVSYSTAAGGCLCKCSSYFEHIKKVNQRKTLKLTNLRI